jgi:hypothetical protein
MICYYSNYQTIMRQIDYSESTHDLCVSILDHDPRMISAINNPSLEIVKSVIDRSTSYVPKIYLNSMSIENQSKVLDYIYSKNKRYKKDIMELILHKSNDESLTTKVTNVKPEFYNLFKKIIKDYPMYLLMIEIHHIEWIFSNAGESASDFVSGLKVEKIFKTLFKIFEEVEGGMNKSDSLDELMEAKLRKLYGHLGFAAPTFMKYEYLKEKDDNRDMFDHLNAFKKAYNIESNILDAILLKLKIQL